MQTSIQIIKEIKSGASKLQRKLLTLPGKSEDPRNPLRPINKNQQAAFDSAQKGLSGWRGWELGELEKAFTVEN